MSSELFTTEKHWPLRLLHLEGDTFRSVQRVGSCTYDSTEKPEYNILSYTWGRWMTAAGKTLPIENVTWKIPVVGREGFSVEAFAKVVRHRNILKPFILEALKRDAIVVDRPWVNKVWKGVETIFSDPWFSSLWTLQEGFIRQDAVLLFDDATWIDIPKFESYTPTGGPCTFLDLVKAYQNISSRLSAVLWWHSDRLGHDGIILARKTCQRLDDVGIPCMARSHAIALYGVSSFRNSSRENDRIYGIMQVFGLALGKVAHPDKDFTLSQLEDQLGEAVNKANPVLAQSFVHLADPRPNRRWCIHRHMYVFSASPDIDRRPTPPTPYCRIIFDGSSGFAKFQGHAALLGDLMRNIGSYRAYTFDDTTENRSKLPESFFQIEPRSGLPGEEIEGALELSFGQETSILVIGELRSGPSEWLGVIAYPVSISGYPEKTCWARIGVCTWHTSIQYMRSELWDLFRKERIYMV
ncbi:hypothetical protein VMCG_07059 [Cytospora schulzeri]|uniref:Heterokaryon incompatibility domain-containing protein n=1 Tax=Cytospora schulzeri TaxID=448051 RepID=A0A423W3Y6_9PEZI|nr:hypothetical protein VMCG_07059 [Valsa malicola]